MPRPWVIIYPSKKITLEKQAAFLALCLQLPCWKYWVLSSCIKNNSWLEWRQNPGGLAGVVATTLTWQKSQCLFVTSQKGHLQELPILEQQEKQKKVPVEYELKKNKQTRLLIVRKNAINPAEKKQTPPGCQLITSNMSLRPTILSFRKLLHWSDAQRYDMTYGA